jgi:hypothetical protein
VVDAISDGFVSLGFLEMIIWWLGFIKKSTEVVSRIMWKQGRVPDFGVTIVLVQMEDPTEHHLLLVSQYAFVALH